MKISITISLTLVLALSATADAGRPKNGPFVEHHANGNKSVEGYYADSRRDGYWTRWYESGKLKSKIRWIKGKKHGLEQRYNHQGNLTSETQYREGKRHGSHLSQAWTKTDGKWVVKSKTTGSYREGKKNGEWVTTHADGRVDTERYKRGKRVD